MLKTMKSIKIKKSVRVAKKKASLISCMWDEQSTLRMLKVHILYISMKDTSRTLIKSQCMWIE